MTLLRWICMLLGMASLLCCAIDSKSAKPIDVEGLNTYVNGPRGRFSTWFSGVYYAGSDDHYDYVIVSRRVEMDVFKLKPGQLRVVRRINLEKDEKKWISITEMFPSNAKQK